MLLFCATQLLSNSEKAEERKIGLGIKSKKRVLGSAKFSSEVRILMPTIDSENMQRINKDASLACEGIFFF